MSLSAQTRPQADAVLRLLPLDDLRPHVVNLTRGEFSTDGIMQTSKADVDAIFDEHLPAFLARAKTTVPLVIWAHGGIVSEKAGLSIAGLQIPWWLDNGAYPLHFVWETGFVETFKQLLGCDPTAIGTVTAVHPSMPPGPPSPGRGGSARNCGQR